MGSHWVVCALVFITQSIVRVEGMSGHCDGGGEMVEERPVSEGSGAETGAGG